MASNSTDEVQVPGESDDGVCVYIRPSKKKIMTSQIVTNDELTNLIQERLANRRTGERTEFANQLARKLIKKLHDKDEKNRKIKGKKKRGTVPEIENDKSDSDSDNTPPPVIKKKPIKKKRETSNMTGDEIAMTILSCKKIFEEKNSSIDKKVASKFTSTLKSRLANKLKTNPSSK